MPKQILILHAPDAIEKAVELKVELESRSFEVITFKEAMSGAPFGKAILVIHEELVVASPAIIVIASPQLFRDNFLIQIVEMSIFSKKFLPVLSGFPNTPLPVWLSIYANANLNRVGEQREREFEKLVRGLMSRGL